MKRRALFVVLVAIAFLCWLAVPKQSAEHLPAVETAAHKVSAAATPKPSPPTPKPSPSSSTTAPVSAPATKPAAPKLTVPATAACTLLTPAIAQQILGTGVTFVPTNNDSSTPDSATTTCTYANGDTISLVAHVALTSLGSSENAVVFGSDKPSGASDVQGIGQAAYWDPNAGQLNVLSENNWYVIRRDSGSNLASVGESDVEALARLLAFRV